MWTLIPLFVAVSLTGQVHTMHTLTMEFATDDLCSKAGSSMLKHQEDFPLSMVVLPPAHQPAQKPAVVVTVSCVQQK